MINQILECLFAGMRIGFQAFLSVLPFYNQLSGLKEQIIAWSLGISVTVISLFLLIPKAANLLKKVFR